MSLALIQCYLWSSLTFHTNLSDNCYAPGMSWRIQNLNLTKWKCSGRKIYFKQSHLGNKKKPPNFRWCQNSCRVKSYHESVLAALFPQFNTQCITHNALLFAHLRLISKVHGWFIMLQNYLETSGYYSKMHNWKWLPYHFYSCPLNQASMHESIGICHSKKLFWVHICWIHRLPTIQWLSPSSSPSSSVTIEADHH